MVFIYLYCKEPVYALFSDSFRSTMKDTHWRKLIQWYVPHLIQFFNIFVGDSCWHLDDSRISFCFRAFYVLQFIEELLIYYFQLWAFDEFSIHFNIAYLFNYRYWTSWIHDFKDKRSSCAEHSHINIFSACRMQVNCIVCRFDHRIDLLGDFAFNWSRCLIFIGTAFDVPGRLRYTPS